MSNYRSVKDIAATARQNLKAEFPDCKFSVTVKDGRSLTVALMQAPFKIFEKDTDIHGYAVKGSASLNHHFMTHDRAERYDYQTGQIVHRCNGGVFMTAKAWDVMVRACEIGNAENWDKSDIQTDYFNCNYYFNLNIGKWDKPAIEGDVVEEVAPVAEVVEAAEVVEVVEVTAAPVIEVAEVAEATAVESSPAVEEPAQDGQELQVAPIAQQAEEITPAVEEASPASVEIEGQAAQSVTVRIVARPGDIRAKGAFDGTSFSPEQRERQYINSYLSQMAEVEKEFGAWATVDNVAEINEALELYRAGYTQRYNASLAAHSRIRSQMITGAGGWTGRMVRSMEKKNAAYDNRRNEFVEWNNKAIDRLYSRFNPRFIAKAPIMSSDHDALDKLQEKIDRAEKLQQWMKDTNATIRKHSKAGKDAQAAALVAMGHTQAAAAKLVKSDSVWEIGYAHFELTNNNANIRRMKQRVAEIERLRATPTTSTEVATSAGVDGKIRIVDNTEANRLQLFFPGKPSGAIRSKLKENGFRWTPSVGCWQAYRNYRARTCADEVLKMA